MAVRVARRGRDTLTHPSRSAGKASRLQHGPTPRVVQRFQFFVFCLGILPLVLLDCFMILSHLMPQGALFATHAEFIVLAIVFAIYLTLMTVAMYPGRAIPSHADWDELFASDEFHPRRIQQEDVFPQC